MEKHQWIATAAFGIEGIAARELTRMGIPAKAEAGGARFEGALSDGLRANLWLRTADRVLLEVWSFEARSFEALFEQTRSLPWERWISGHTSFPVSGNCARSQLMSIRDCQSIIKKAIVERLKTKYHCNWLPEDKETVAVDFQIHQDRVRLTLDSSGVALNRRGYRTWNGEAPLRETLAAALVDLSPWRPGMPLLDPMCGTGTLLIEAALKISHRAPGLNRSFALEGWQNMPEADFLQIRAEAQEAFDPSLVSDLHGSDINPEAIQLAKRHLHAAGLDGRIDFQTADMRTVQRAEASGVILCNPPYGERLGDRKSCEALYHDFGIMCRSHPAWSVCVITSHPAFERHFGRRAERKRRFYNGRLECEYMVFPAKREE